MTEERFSLAEGWTIWPWFILRGAGLPAALLEPLSAPATIAAIDRARELEDAAAAARAAAIAALEQRLALLRGDDRKPVGHALKQLRLGRVPELPETLALAGAERALADARATAEHALATETVRIGRALQAVAADPMFREACLWQNRAAVHTAIDRVRDGHVGRASQHRQHEAVVARYLQRYCAKNDSIGFFGPIGWGVFAEDGHARAGSSLLAQRTVYFEHWGIDELATAFTADDELLDIAPRRMPTLWLDGCVLHYGVDQHTELPEEVAAVLGACDGRRSARELAGALAADGVLDPDEVYQVLRDLRARNLVCWSLEIPMATSFPERTLRALLERAGGPRARAGLAALGELEAARDRIAGAAGDPEALEPALDTLDAVFVRVTGGAATRKAGEMYAGRTLVYEDCRRDYELQLGRAVLDQLGPPLALVLQSARWYTHEMATRVLGALDAVYDQLCRECGETVIAYPRFFDRAAPHLPAEGDAVVGDVVAELHRRWRDVLAFDDGERRVTRTTAALGEPVRRAFAAPAPGWPGAQFHAPDVMIGARSVEDVLAGRGTIVLGEVHTGRTTVTIPLFLKECPDAEAVRAAERADARVPRVRPVLPKRMATRVDAGRGADRDFEIELGTTPSHLPRDRVLAAGELVVERMSRGLVVRTRDGGVVLDAIVFFEIYLQVSTDQHWTMLGEQPHEPRVTIDGVVMSRERWRFARSELPFADAPRGLPQLAAARKWATDHGLPRCVFAKVPDERKPVFVDLASPVYVEQLAKLARSSPSFAISEMLPGLDELWLADAEDRRYTCELRMNVVDPVAWCPPGVR